LLLASFRKQDHGQVPRCHNDTSSLFSHSTCASNPLLCHRLAGCPVPGRILVICVTSTQICSALCAESVPPVSFSWQGGFPWCHVQNV
jgi:hypothetical protein